MDCINSLFANVLVYPMNEILDNFLYIGSLYDYGNIDKLHAAGITHILDVSSSETMHCNMLSILQNFRYVHYDMMDTITFPIYKYFEGANRLLNEVRRIGGKILVNCHKGKSRSVTIVLNYIMETYNLTLDEAYAYVKERRSISGPNDGFINQLRIYDTLRHITN
jgi:protein-tyrosine phosphatase